MLNWKPNLKMKEEKKERNPLFCRYKTILPKEPIQKTKKFVHKTFTNLKSLNPLSCWSKTHQNHQIDVYYLSYPSDWSSDFDHEKQKVEKSELSSIEENKYEDVGGESFMKFAVATEKKEKKKRGSFRKGKGSSIALAEKLKDLEMMDFGNMETLLDVEEAVLYYSRLTSPLHIDIVDNFFVDIYSDLSSSSNHEEICLS